MNFVPCVFLRTFFVIIFILFTVFIGDNPTYAQPIQRIEIPSSWNPVGSGARALGIGGAFIAIADDATAASWNPGGLIQLETPEFSIVGSYFSRAENLSFGNAQETSGSEDVSNANLNYLSAAYPFSLFSRNMIVSVNYQYLYNFKREWNFPLNIEGADISGSQLVDYEQEGGLSAIGLAYCIQVSPQFSFGLTLNYWGDGLNEWDQKTKQTGSGSFYDNTFYFRSDMIDKYSFNGINANMGFLWNINGNITIGGVLKTPFSADLKQEKTLNYSIDYPDAPDFNIDESTSTDEDQELDMPMSYGIGIACRFSDQLTAAFDIYRTKWDKFVLTDADGNKISPISGKSSDSDIDPTNQARLGAEYLFFKNRFIVPVRVGVFYDPAPAEGKPDDIYGFSLGSGIAKDKIVFDIAYQYRYGNNVGTYIMESMDFSMDIREHTVYASLIYHF
ncbi:OmpP1/FadL family transporter [Thermodesulfobacteriota bacterium]